MPQFPATIAVRIFPLFSRNPQVLPRRHSVVHRFKHLSFQAGTWCMFMQTALWQASVHASFSETPQTVTHVLGVASLASPPILLKSLSDVQTLSQTKRSSSLEVPLLLHNKERIVREKPITIPLSYRGRLAQPSKRNPIRGGTRGGVAGHQSKERQGSTLPENQILSRPSHIVRSFPLDRIKDFHSSHHL